MHTPSLAVFFGLGKPAPVQRRALSLVYASSLMLLTAGLVGVPLIFYGLANGVISPMQKSLLIQYATPDLRGGIVSVDRLIQQLSKTLSISAVGLLLMVAEISTIFWFLGALSFVSVGLMATMLLRRIAMPC